MPEKKEYIRKTDGYRVHLTADELDGIHDKADFELYSKYVEGQLAHAKAVNEKADAAAAKAEEPPAKADLPTKAK